jgi:hypothetical protein
VTIATLASSRMSWFPPRWIAAPSAMLGGHDAVGPAGTKAS